MPREDRNIYFDLEESYKAIFSLCVINELKKPPAGIITSAIVRPDDDQTFRIKFEDKLLGTSQVVEYTRDFIAAALILYCRSAKIPLPKKSLKSVSVDVGVEDFILKVLINGGRDRRGN